MLNLLNYYISQIYTISFYLRFKYTVFKFIILSLNPTSTLLIVAFLVILIELVNFTQLIDKIFPYLE